LVFPASCSTLPLYKKKNTPKKRTLITSLAHAAPVIPDTKQFIAPVAKPPTQAEYSTRKHKFEFLAVAALL
jgi:hypothetical protein